MAVARSSGLASAAVIPAALIDHPFQALAFALARVLALVFDVIAVVRTIVLVEGLPLALAFALSRVLVVDDVGLALDRVLARVFARVLELALALVRILAVDARVGARLIDDILAATLLEIMFGISISLVENPQSLNRLMKAREWLPIECKLFLHPQTRLDDRQPLRHSVAQAPRFSRVALLQDEYLRQASVVDIDHPSIRHPDGHKRTGGAHGGQQNQETKGQKWWCRSSAELA
mmetsp:Transcript_114688/g.364525  ORF Transcript_114688/g.364525 Transcript_114688/m.364525 type:complete len:234 (-) Transcript_114688:62-763(-)